MRGAEVEEHKLSLLQSYAAEGTEPMGHNHSQIWQRIGSCAMAEVN